MAKLGVTLKPITLSWKAAVDRALGCCNIDDHHQRPPDPAPHEFESDKSNLKHSLRRLHHHLTHNHHNHRCTASSSNSPTMDPKLWSNLPIHLLERILALLPVPSLLRLRSVSKQFNELLQSPTLFATVVSTRRHSSSQQPWYLFRGEGRECVAFNPELDSWCKLPLGFLPSSKARVVAAAAGLLCLRHRDDKMFVCNPLSKAWVELPPKRHLWRYPIVGMVVDEEARSYKVVVAGSNNSYGKNLITEVYCSVSKSWKLVKSHPVQHHFQTNAVFCNGSLYSAGFDAILAYEVKGEQWVEVKGPAMEDTQLMLPQICECNGLLLMVEVVSEQFLMTRVTIWALQSIGSQWFKMASMPNHLLEEVISISGTRLFTYYGHGDLVCFTIARRRVLVYSISYRTWRWLPCCPFLQGFSRRCMTLSYEPRVDATV